MVIPIVYSDKFYKDVLDPSLDDVNKLSAWLISPRNAGRAVVDAQSTTRISQWEHVAAESIISPLPLRLRRPNPPPQSPQRS